VSHPRMLTRLGALILGASLTALALSQAPAPASGVVSPALEKAGRTFITRGALEAPIRFLASDLLEGRGPGTRGDELARLYLQTQLEGMGFQPAFADGAWQQPFDIVGLTGAFPRPGASRARRPRSTSATGWTTSQSAGSRPRRSV